MTPWDLLQAYTALSRSGVVTASIRACERAWGPVFEPNHAAIAAIRNDPGYETYVTALRGLLRFPFTVYRVTTAAAYEDWKAQQDRRVLAVSVSSDFTHLLNEVYPDTDQKRVVVSIRLSDPRAVIMRGLIEGYELVIDTGHIRPEDVSVITSS
jgi:hypothetical protein